MTDHATPAFLAMRDRLLDLRQQAKARGEPMFMKVPESWFNDGGKPLYRCENHHLSTWILKSEAYGGDCCLECQAYVMMTFPSDVEGQPLPEVLP